MLDLLDPFMNEALGVVVMCTSTRANKRTFTAPFRRLNWAPGFRMTWIMACVAVADTFQQFSLDMQDLDEESGMISEEEEEQEVRVGLSAK